MEITVIKDENQSYFQAMMPDYLWRDTDLAIGVIEEGTACALLAIKEEEQMWKINWLIVADEFRRQGIGFELLMSVHELAGAVGIDTVYCQFSENDSAAALGGCLEKCMFRKDPFESPIYRVSFGEISSRYVEHEINDKTAHPMPLAEVTSRSFRKFQKIFSERNREDDAAPTLKELHEYDPDASFLLMREGEPVGGILLQKEDDVYVLSCLCVFSGVSPTQMMSLFCASYRALRERCKADTLIYINAMTETTRKMVMQMTDGKAVEVGREVVWSYDY